MTVTPKLRDLQAARRMLEMWERESKSPGADANDPAIGRRIEADGCWSIYKIFNSVQSSTDATIEHGLTSAQSLIRLGALQQQAALQPSFHSSHKDPSFTDWVREQTSSCH